MNSRNKAIIKKVKLVSHIRLYAVVAVLLLGAIQVTIAQEVVDFFRRNCMSCHTIGGGRLTGPDLKNVSERQNREWLIRFITDPKGLINRGDPYAVKLKQESRDVIMPSLPGLTPELAGALLDLIDSESQLEESQFVGLQMTDEPFRVEDVQQGYEFFIGTRRLQNGGSACISCHTVNGLKGLSGGRLGPDLTLVFERLQGRRSLASWLLAPATTTMQPLFDDKPMQQDEILPLVAFFEQKAKSGGKEDRVAILNFFLMGLGGAILGLVLFDVFWKNRFRGVRKPQVQAASSKQSKLQS